MHTSERLYFADSFLRTFTGAATDVREQAGSNGEPIWQLSLDRTAFYPTSGGQPFDTSQLSAISPDGTPLKVPVIDQSSRFREQGQYAVAVTHDQASNYLLAQAGAVATIRSEVPQQAQPSLPSSPE